jgi:hypothetical protein
MAIGDWSVRLKSTVPRTITNPLEMFFGHIVVTPSRVPPEMLDSSPNYPGAAKNILLVVGDSAALTAGDWALRGHLEWSGHSVTIADDSAAEVTRPSVHHLVIVAPSSVAGTIGTKYRGRGANALPVLHMQADAWTSTRGAFCNPGTTITTGAGKYGFYVAGGDADFAWTGQTPGGGTTLRLFEAASGNGLHSTEALWGGGTRIMAPSGNASATYAFSYGVGDAAGSGPGAMTARVVGWGPTDALLASGLFWYAAQWLAAAIEWLAPAVAPVDATTLIDTAIYTGVVRRLRRSPSGSVELSGPGLAAWLGDEAGKGVVASVAPPAIAGFIGWFDHVRPRALAAGTVASPNPGLAVFTPTFAWSTPRKIIDAVCDYWAGEWRITPDGRLHGGTAAALYGSSPVAYAVEGGALDPSIYVERVLAEVTIGAEWSADDVTTAVSAVGTGATGSAVLDPDADPGMPWRDLFGNPIDYRDKIDATDLTTAAQLNPVAASELARTGVWRQITVTTGEYLPTRFAPVGSIIGVYSPRVDVEDESNPVTLGGRVIFPVEARLLRATWPIANGCGVYFRSGFAGQEGRVIDLTDWVEFETGPTRLEIDAVRSAPNVARDRRARR